MTRLLTTAAALAFLAGPALAQSTNMGATGASPVMPQTETDSVNGTNGTEDNMGAAARTGDTTAPAGQQTTGSMNMGTDGMSTSSTTPDAVPGAEAPTTGAAGSNESAGTGSTPSGGIVPGQSSN